MATRKMEYTRFKARDMYLQTLPSDGGISAGTTGGRQGNHTRFKSWFCSIVAYRMNVEERVEGIKRVL
jgi:hypothetical protein